MDDRPRLIERIANLFLEQDEGATLHLSGDAVVAPDILPALAAVPIIYRADIQRLFAAGCRRSAPAATIARKHGAASPDRAAALAVFLAKALWYCVDRSIVRTAPHWSQVESLDLNVHIGIWDFDAVICRVLTLEPHREELLDHWPWIASTFSGPLARLYRPASLAALPGAPQMLHGPLMATMAVVEDALWRHLLCARALLFTQAEALEQLGWQCLLDDTTPRRRRPRGNTPFLEWGALPPLVPRLGIGLPWSIASQALALSLTILPMVAPAPPHTQTLA